MTAAPSVPEPLGPLPGFPTRHGADVTKARRVAATLRSLIRGVDPEPTPAQWRARAEALGRGDPLADAVVLWLEQVGMGPGMALVNRALDAGIAAVPEAPPALVAFFTAIERTPAWVDPRRLDLGAEACHLGGLLGLRVLAVILMGGYQASSINRTLVLTGQLKNGAYRRVVETARWWRDCTAVGGMARFAPGFKATVHVRLRHAMIRQRIRRLPEWDAAVHGLPVNQSDMQVTYLGFSIFSLVAQRVLGVRFTREEAAAKLHLWRYIGWLMGVEEDLLTEEETPGLVAMYQNILSQAPADDTTRQLGQALLNSALERPYPTFRHLRGHWERMKYQSLYRFFFSGESCRDLGLPTWVPPWYPLTILARCYVPHRLLHRLPGGRDRLLRRGRAAQEWWLRVNTVPPRSH